MFFLSTNSFYRRGIGAQITVVGVLALLLIQCLQDDIIFRNTCIRHVETHSMFSHYVFAFVEENSFLPEILLKRNVINQKLQLAINSYSTTSQLPIEPLPGNSGRIVHCLRQLHLWHLAGLRAIHRIRQLMFTFGSDLPLTRERLTTLVCRILQPTSNLSSRLR
jgi:hypothetical protein